MKTVGEETVLDPKAARRTGLAALAEPQSGSGERRSVDQRKEPRRPARGKVTVHALHGQVAGQLVDLSPSGFRMAHADARLEPGQELEFDHKHASGKARVIWNRIIETRVETGFLIVERR